MVDQPSTPQGGAEKPPTVFIATPMYGGMATASYTWSMAHTPAVFIRNGVGLLYQYRPNDALIANARNQLAHQFLETDATHLMWIDADIGFDARDIITMLLADRDIVCGVYPVKAIHWDRVAHAVNNGVEAADLHKHVGLFVVKTMDEDDGQDKNQEAGTASADPDGLAEVEAGGTGFMLVKRGVFERLSEHVVEYAVDDGTLKEFFTTGIDPETNKLVGEDYYFCRLARSWGYRVYAAPWVHLTHTGQYIYEGHLQPDFLT